ncbi:Stk1 family PASTA domain-containing Ser/Thr kinase [Agrococcus jejuensis]|uniref:Stk1 family PASTA domain-containing Ser/Thr kinase n=1 Tax=Agrococcus jejuensis TaxID=399736 RepID=UPI000B81D58F|nr:Stk1 family PASTA domain-containing Ser/Thr kinase [Agrococcus jejuensis]
MPATHDDPLSGRLVDGRYQVGDRIARGGMATVYVATDLRLDRRIALKVMHPHLADDDQFRERFIQEARQAARLAHPNVVNVLDQGEEPGLAYLAMEHIPSITLRDLLLERGRIRPAQALQVLEAVLAGLSSAHRAGIVHRDIKPENVLLAHDGRIKIADFGLARAATANTATGKALLGTIAYLSPELVTRGIADARSDIYAVGIMLFEMLTGKQPYTGEQPLQIAYQHAHEQVPSPSSLEPSIPHELDLLVHWATHKDPNLRPADAGEMLDEVVRIRAGERSTTSAHTRMLPVATASDAETTVVEAQRPAPRRGGIATGDLPALDTGDVPPAARALQRKAQARRRRGFVLLVLVVVLALVAAGVGWWLNAGPGGETTVPDIAQGTSEVDARAALEEVGLVGAEQTEGEYAADVVAGTLIRTDPAPGETLRRGEAVTLVLSLGIEMLPAPELSGTPSAAVEAALVSAGFAYSGSLPVFDDTTPSGSVVTLWVDDGQGTAVASQAEWPRGLAMLAIVSRGPQPTLVGLDQASAQTVLQSVGLTLGAVTPEASRDVPEGQVIRAEYPEGTQPDSGAAVAIVVSSGPPQVQIPADILSMSIPNAVAALQALSFQVVLDSNVPEALQPIVQPNAVSPEPGSSADEGSTVTLTAQY